MVCDRCIMAVEAILKTNEIAFSKVALGEVELLEMPSQSQIAAFEKALINIGFEIIDNRKKQIVEKIKTSIVELIYQKNSVQKVNLSTYLSQILGHDYPYLSNLFSEIEAITIEKYFIVQKIERVKELLEYDEFSLNEIAFQLNYSSGAYLSNQFKKVCGITPSAFKNQKTEKRKALDKV